MFIEERYEIEINKNNSDFEFTSVGKKGEIRKVVRFENYGVAGVVNLGFGDKDLITGKIDDKVVTDNGDFEKVLVTVGFAVYLYSNLNPQIVITFKGTNKARIRLYRIAISKFIERISEDFEVHGLTKNDTDWHIFERNISYKAFLLKRKNNIL